MATKVFKGANVFLSRNLVPPEMFDALHDALKLNGAAVFLCCDPTRNAPNDYHVIASPEHEKFEDLRSKGCNLLGPQCVLSCAKEHRLLPNQGFTCCLAMDGVNILASGFETEEKADIAKMVVAMGGTMLTKASADVSFVIVKNVLASKYKSCYIFCLGREPGNRYAGYVYWKPQLGETSVWALNNLKKPIVVINWLLQCWKEHRVVPQESFKVLPFSGLTICVSGIPADERKEIEKLAVENGGKYSAALTKRCTHLVCNASEGDKYKVAKRWGHICVVTRKWFHQSVARRACLSEKFYPVQGTIASSACTLKTVEHYSQGKSIRNSQYSSSSLPAASDSETVVSAHALEHDLENSLPNTCSTFMEAPSSFKEANDSAADLRKTDSSFDPCVADDSQSDDDDLYLSECRIMPVGFEASRLRVIVDMVRRGGGTRYTSFSEKLTHVIVGNPSEGDIKEVRSLTALGVIYVVKAAWLEECIREKKEVPVLQRHIAYNILLPKDPAFFNKPMAASMTSVQQGKSAPQPVACTIQDNKNPWSQALSDVKEEAKLKVQSSVNNGIHDVNLSTVFKGKLFRFSSSFPEEQRPEIVQWVNEGGGQVVTDPKKVHFIVERHGVRTCMTNNVWNTYVSSHWIHSCLKDGCLLDVGNHILYSPLPCNIPFPGLEGCRFCVSQYDLKERQLLRNLCYVLGVKFIEKLNRKVTHLLCQFADGDKYEAACRWGIPIARAEWIYECAMQNKVVDLKEYYPKDLTAQDREAGFCTSTQYPTQSAGVPSGNDASQCASLSHDLSNVQTVASIRGVSRHPDKFPSSSKRARLFGSHLTKDPLLNDSSDDNVHRNDPAENNPIESNNGVPSLVPDVAAAIEDLLEQTSKIQDQKSEETSGCHEKFLSSNPTMLGQRHTDSHPDPGPSNHWINRSHQKDDIPSVDATNGALYDGFSETQTDSQVVGYEEDLSGRQMIIDRVRSTSCSMGSTDGPQPSLR